MEQNQHLPHLTMTDEEKAAVRAYQDNPAIMGVRIKSGCPDCGAVTFIERDTGNDRRFKLSVLHNSSCPLLHGGAGSQPTGGVE